MATGNSKDTFFQSGGGAGQGASDYLKDTFDDVSLAANSNGAFTDSALTNPLTQFFFNDDFPKFGATVLLVQDLVLLDRSKWISNKPTYKIIFDQDPYNGCFAYCFGNVRLLNNQYGKTIQIKSIDDGAGVSGVLRRVSWLVNPVQGTGTADIVTDGVDTGSDISFSTLAADADNRGVNKFYAATHQASNETKDIHDFRITANEEGTLSLSGILIYAENATTNIDLFPGSTYVDKDKKTTSSLTAQSLPTITGRLGGKSVINKNASNGYTQTTVEPTAVESTGTGNVSTTVTMAAGTGASFPAGTGIVGIATGGSISINSVVSVSTDTLTITPALSVSLQSGVVYRAWSAGPTLAINASLYGFQYSFDPKQAYVNLDTQNFGLSQNADMYYSDPLKRYRVWGDQLSTSSFQGEYGVGFNGATVGFLQVDGYFQAMDIEVAAGVSGLMHGTFSINGCPSWGINEAVSGVAKKTVVTNLGPGFHSVYFAVGASNLNNVISKVNFYGLQKNIGITVGLLAQYDTLQNIAERSAINASLLQLGTYERSYADELFVAGPWARGVSTGYAGGVAYTGASNNCVFTYNYYGKNFGIVGSAGTSLVLLVDGASIAATFNVMKTVASEGFHTVQLTAHTGNTRVDAIDYLRTKSPVQDIQKMQPRPELDDAPGVYEAGSTPRNPKSGTIWAPSPQSSEIWVYLWGRWNRFNIQSYSDDPNGSATYIRSHGTSDGAATGATDNIEFFRGGAWATGTAQGSGRYRVAGGDTGFQNFHHIIDGANTSSAVAALFARYNTISWSTLTNKGNVTHRHGSGAFNNRLYNACGTTVFDTAASVSGQSDFWNGASWTTSTNFTGRMSVSVFVVNNLLSVVHGQNSAGTDSATHQTKDTADSVASSTGSPVAGQNSGGSNSPGGKGLATSATNGSGNNTTSYVWDGTSWSAAINAIYTQISLGVNAAFLAGQGVAMTNGGQTAGGASVVNSSQTFNGSSYAFTTSSNTSRGQAQSSGVV